MKKKLILTASIICFCACNTNAKTNNIYHKGWIDFNKNGVMDVFENPKAPIEERIKDLLRQMTVEEKTCQMATLYGSGRVLNDSLPTEKWKQEIWKDGIANIDEQLNGLGRGRRAYPHLIYPFSNHAKAINNIQRWFVENTRLGIPVDFSNEGIHGLNHQKATPLPAPIGIGSTWNRQLVRQAGDIIGKEAKALGYTNIYTPILDVSRDPRWGRVMETYGEEPYLISELGIQVVEGIQAHGVASTLKHYAAYSVPKGGRDAAVRTDPHIAPRELHTLYMYPFKKVIQTAHPMGVMSSYNDWDGVPVTASRYFLTTLLREQYGFRGYVVSDSEAVEYVLTKHHVATSYGDAIRQCAEAGLNVRTNFTQPDEFIKPLREEIAAGRLSMKTVDERVAEVLRVKFQLGLFDNPYVENPDAADRIAGADRHADFADEIQRQSLVLLKNSNNTLPLDATKLKKVLIAGPLAKETNFMINRYGPQALDCTSFYDGIEKYLKAKGVTTAYAKGCDVRDAMWPDSEIVPTALTDKERNDINAAVAAAADCDVIIAALGEDESCTGESKSRTSLQLPGRQQQLLEALKATGKPVVLLLVNGQPLTINWAERNVDAILETWMPGPQGGKAVAETVFGDYNPGGKLSITFPKSVGQIEFNFPYKPGSQDGQYFKGPNGSGSTRVNGALYPFGYGLSYTTFKYSNLDIKQITKHAGTPITVTADVTNTGKRDGDEVVQLYLKDVVASVIPYNSVLRGFERIHLKAGETRRVEFTLQPDDLAILDRNMEWTVEPGKFEIWVGSSSEDIRLKGEFTIEQ